MRLRASPTVIRGQNENRHGYVVWRRDECGLDSACSALLWACFCFISAVYRNTGDAMTKTELLSLMTAILTSSPEFSSIEGAVDTANLIYRRIYDDTTPL